MNESRGELPRWRTAHGDAICTARIRTELADFQVTEDCRIDFSGDGEHEFLWIEKSGNNTHWVAEQLAKFAGIPVRDVGYSGLKDRHAITQQWFSVRCPRPVDWQALQIEGVRVLERCRHRRKLRRGAHRANRFRIALRLDDVPAHAAAIEARLAVIAAQGVPNYFGDQRFGRDGGNIGLCRQWLQGRKLSRHKRSIAISAGRSLLFNAILDRRTAGGTWNRLLAGELANLDGSASVFAVAGVDTELDRRCAEFDIHPSGSLWGAGAPVASGDVARLEIQAVALHADIAEGLQTAGVEPGHRALRVQVRELRCSWTDSACWLEFELPKGAYATAVLREIIQSRLSST